VALEAELKLMILAYAPLQAAANRPIEEQMQILGTTVWPTAIKVAPLANEDVHHYFLRVCAGPLATVCRTVVPEYQGHVLRGEVWRRLTERAREAVARCLWCSGDEAFSNVVKAYEVANADATSLARRDERRGSPTRWPSAGPTAMPWPADVPLFAIDPGGAASLDGEPVPSVDWRGAMRFARSKGSKTLGVFLSPADRVDTLRAVMAEAASAGFTEVALQTRDIGYPYPLMGYRIATKAKPGLAKAPARDVDTIQVLIEALDASIGLGVPARI
jgi:hypothetical protein